MGQKTASLNPGNSDETFSVQWYDPFLGGSLQQGSKQFVKASEAIDLGDPPTRAEKDWVILLRKE
jgi:hypothetical protein